MKQSGNITSMERQPILGCISVMTTEQIIDSLLKYIADWRKLEREYAEIPSWRFFKQLKNIRQREELTRIFVAKMVKVGIIK